MINTSNWVYDCITNAITSPQVSAVSSSILRALASLMRAKCFSVRSSEVLELVYVMI